jgi:hypothetical protein
MAQSQTQRYEGSGMTQFLVSRFDTIREIWITASAKRKAVWEAQVVP